MILHPPPPQDIVLVGATGDLARRKLLPAIYNLFLENLLPEQGRIIGYARQQLDDAQFHQLAERAIREHSRSPFAAEAWQALCQRFSFVRAGEQGFVEVARRCTESTRLVYLAVPPSAFAGLAAVLSSHGLVAGSRLVVEKPFGHDLASARQLSDALHLSFDESQIFRIDHYLGKETVQNLLFMRFGNTLFERVWNRDAIDHMQITVAEALGVEGRGSFYEEVGALRDIVQNHVMQVLALLTMEPPSSFAAEAIRDEKVKVLRAISPVDPARVIRGQYTAGVSGAAPAVGYREEAGVKPSSDTETFVALTLAIENWRWSGVPIHVRTGKRLARGVTEVHIELRSVPISYFEGTGMEELPSDHLTLRIQPDAGISFNFTAKEPGPAVRGRSARMNFAYGDGFMSEPQEAYERLLHDAMTGDHTLFLREDGVEQAWRVVEQALAHPAPLHLYPTGSWGPAEAAALVAPREWHLH